MVARGLSQGAVAAGVELGFLVECDTGLRRNGVQRPEDALPLALLVDSLPGLRFDGLMTYPSSRETPMFFAPARARSAQPV